jgi:hypothetical protein
MLVRQRPYLASITPALPSQLPSVSQANTRSGPVLQETSVGKWRQIKENRIWGQNL